MKKIAIFGAPRSGTSWLGQIFNSHPDVLMRFQPLFSYSHKGMLTAYSTRSEINLFFEEIAHSQDAFALMKATIHKNYPVFSKTQTPTHIAFKEMRYLHIIENILKQCPDIKVLGIVRNPLACLASWIRTPKEFNPEWDILREWRTAPSKNRGRPEEFFGFDKWREVVTNFVRFEATFPDQFILVRYDQLRNNTVETTARLLKFCDLGMPSQVTDFIKASQSTHDADPYSVFRSNANDDGWHEVLPDEIVQQIWLELSNSPLQSFLDEMKTE